MPTTRIDHEDRGSITRERQLGGNGVDAGEVLNFQRLDVYRCSIDFLAKSIELPQELPRGHAVLADQLRRAALSIPLNIAEGAGRATEPDSARHFAIARGSTMECAAIVDTFRVLGVIDAERHTVLLDLLERIASMLTRLCR